jgi:hypothetical protein
LGNEFFGKKGKKPSEEKSEPEKSPEPKLFHCEHCVRDGHLAEFYFRTKREERLPREFFNMTCTALLVVCLSLGWCRGLRVWCVPFTFV